MHTGLQCTVQLARRPVWYPNIPKFVLLAASRFHVERRYNYKSRFVGKLCEIHKPPDVGLAPLSSARPMLLSFLLVTDVEHRLHTSQTLFQGIVVRECL